MRSTSTGNIGVGRLCQASKLSPKVPQADRSSNRKPKLSHHSKLKYPRCLCQLGHRPLLRRPAQRQRTPQRLSIQLIRPEQPRSRLQQILRRRIARSGRHRHVSTAPTPSLTQHPHITNPACPQLFQPRHASRPRHLRPPQHSHDRKFPRRPHHHLL
jgi:hypothetical protein